MKRRTFLASAATITLTSRVFAAAPKVRVAVIGHTGRGNYGHGIDTMWLSMPETEIVGVADADPVGLAAVQKKLQVEKGFANYEKMLDTLKPEIAAIGPRHIDQHRDMIMAAIHAGVRGIYLEKPFCRSLAEADEIIAACKASGTKLALAHRNRYHPVLPRLTQILKEGAIGQVLEFRARGKEDARGGALDLWVLGGHLFNLIHFFAGAPVNCSASMLLNGKPITKADLAEGAEGVGPLAGNEVHARFHMQSGVQAFFDSVQNAGVKAAGFGVQIIGTEGVIDLRTDEEPTAHLLAGSPFRPVTTPRAWVPITSAGISKPEPTPDIKTAVMGHVLAGRDLIASIKQDREPLCSALDGRVILEMVAAVFESHRLAGQRVELPLKDRSHPLTRL